MMGGNAQPLTAHTRCVLQCILQMNWKLKLVEKEASEERRELLNYSSIMTLGVPTAQGRIPPSFPAPPGLEPSVSPPPCPGLPGLSSSHARTRAWQFSLLWHTLVPRLRWLIATRLARVRPHVTAPSRLPQRLDCPPERNLSQQADWT